MIQQYNTWPRKNDISVIDVCLDPINPRIPGNNPETPQSVVIGTLVAQYQVYELAKSIAENGFYPDELMVITFEDEKWVCLEGNRRVSSLKLLANPSSAPQAVRNKFERLAEGINIESLLNPYFVVAPSRQAAKPLLFAKHTLNTVMRWSPIMQAEFYYREFQDGQNEERLMALSEEYNISAATLRANLRRYQLYENIRSLSYGDNTILQKIDDKQKFEITNIERLIFRAKSMELIGIKHEDFSFSVENPDKYNFVLKQVVIEIMEGIITSRTHNTATEIQAKIESILERFEETAHEITEEEGAHTNDESDTGDYSDASGPSEQHSDHSNGDSSQDQDDPEQEPPTPTPRPRNLHARKKLIPSNSASKLSVGVNSKAQRLYAELKRLNIEKHEILTAVGLRTFLDLSVDQYIETFNINFGQGKPTLSDKVRRVAQNLRDVKSVMTNDELDYILTESNTRHRELRLVGELHSYVHRPDRTPTANDLIVMWDNMQNYLKKLWHAIAVV